DTPSQVAFVPGAAAPAPGGPADRRWFDRDLPPSDLRASEPVPVMASMGAPGRSPVATQWAQTTAQDRTSVPSAAGAVALAEPATEAPPAPPPAESPLERILRGEPRAMLYAFYCLARQDTPRRR